MWGPVNVTVNCLIRTISKIDDFNMEYSAQITFREQWQDHRLAYKDVLRVSFSALRVSHMIAPHTHIIHGVHLTIYPILGSVQRPGKHTVHRTLTLHYSSLGSLTFTDSTLINGI